jgi:thiamine-monophosphate kinase
VVVGGDLSAGSELVITGTALGTLATGRAVTRSGARPGDVVALAGRTGRSGAGWALLRRGLGPPSPAGARLNAELSAAAAAVVAALIGEHRRPSPPYEAGVAAAEAGATAMIDTSDGLLRDAARIARAAGVLINLDREALRPDSDLLLAAAVLGEPDPLGWILSGGEDHALLATFPPGAAIPPPFRRIGTVREEGSHPVLLAGAAPPVDAGWRHFA